MAKDPEKILIATLLPPSIKHKTIFDTFDQLEEGESFILRNDHDPKPLHYQLSATKGDIFTWDYLQQGPDVFEIRIGKKTPVEKNEETEGGEKVLDGICLDPAVKFQTIMKTFNDLKEGEGFILKNDHDPKPLYYHLSGEHGDIFTWDYLQEGPEVFKIRIAKKILTHHESIKHDFTEGPKEFHDHILFDKNTPETARTIVAKDHRKARVFRKHGLDYAWRGDRPLSEVCKDGSITESVLRKELIMAEEDFSAAVPSMDYYHWDMAFLADYVLQTHHRYVRDNAQRISEIAEEVGRKHGKDYPELAELEKSVPPMIDDFILHMSKEENVLFPAIKHMLGLLQKEEKQTGPGGDIARGIARMEAEHDETRAYLQRFREITHGYQLPDGACEAHKQLYRDLQLFENDTWLHVHLENNILFPKTIILERRISGK